MFVMSRLAHGIALSEETREFREMDWAWTAIRDRRPVEFWDEVYANPLSAARRVARRTLDPVAVALFGLTNPVYSAIDWRTVIELPPQRRGQLLTRFCREREIVVPNLSALLTEVQMDVARLVVQIPETLQRPEAEQAVPRLGYEAMSATGQKGSSQALSELAAPPVIVQGFAGSAQQVLRDIVNDLHQQTPQWSEPDLPSIWASRFNLGLDTFNALVADGRIQILRYSDKRIRIAVPDLPFEYLEQVRKSPRSSE